MANLISLFFQQEANNRLALKAYMWLLLNSSYIRANKSVLREVNITICEGKPVVGEMRVPAQR